LTETKIDISDLKNEGSNIVKELTAFLEEKTNAKVESATTEIILKGKDEENIPRTYLRTLLRKFLHRKELRDTYRVIGGKDNALVIKEKRIGEEEEE